MTAVWTSPKTWATNELVTATLLNTHLRDNLEFLKSPPTNLYQANEAANYTTTSTTFGDVDATNWNFSITTSGGDLMIGFSGVVTHSVANSHIFFDVEIDGVRLGGDDGLVSVSNSAAGVTGKLGAPFVVWKRSLAAGTHTVKLQWKTNAATATLYAGAGTANADVHPQFWCREVS